MLTAAPESFPPFLEEVGPLLDLHYDEISLHKGRFPLNPQFDEYLRRDALGSVVLIALRSAGELVGYIIAFVNPGLHYNDCLTLQMDIFYVHPDHRNGSGGVKLFKALEQEARRRGVRLMFVGSKLHRDASRLFDALNYEPVEMIYAKWLGS